MYTGLRLDYRLRLWGPTSTLHMISVVDELLVYFVNVVLLLGQLKDMLFEDYFL